MRSNYRLKEIVKYMGFVIPLFDNLRNFSFTEATKWMPIMRLVCLSACQLQLHLKIRPKNFENLLQKGTSQ